MMGDWSFGHGWMGFLFWLVLLLGIVALIKYLFGKGGD